MIRASVTAYALRRKNPFSLIHIAEQTVPQGVHLAMQTAENRVMRLRVFVPAPGRYDRGVECRPWAPFRMRNRDAVKLAAKGVYRMQSGSRENAGHAVQPDERDGAAAESMTQSHGQGDGTRPIDGMQREQLRRRIEALGDWFHNMNLMGVQTAPRHFLGDYPAAKWSRIQTALPERMDGLSVLDIGCNAGFHALECKRRGAARVVGVDAGARYLEQARLASEVLGLEVEWREMSVYSLADWREQFDIVLFLGLFYHLRYPVYALDLVVKRVRRTLVFQTMTRGHETSERPAANYDFWDREIFLRPGFPCMYFVEQAYAGDPTNWWIPNTAAVEGILRGADLRIVAHPEEESWVCEPLDAAPGEGNYVWDRELAGTL